MLDKGQADIMFPQHLTSLKKIRVAGTRTKLAMVITIAVSTLIALSGVPALASTSALNDKEVLALATMIAAPVTSTEITITADTIIMATAFCLMAGMAFILGYSLKHDLETAGRIRP